MDTVLIGSFPDWYTFNTFNAKYLNICHIWLNKFLKMDFPKKKLEFQLDWIFWVIDV